MGLYYFLRDVGVVWGNQGRLFLRANGLGRRVWGFLWWFWDLQLCRWRIWSEGYQRYQGWCLSHLVHRLFDKMDGLRLYNKFFFFHVGFFSFPFFLITCFYKFGLKAPLSLKPCSDCHSKSDICAYPFCNPNRFIKGEQQKNHMKIQCDLSNQISHGVRDCLTPRKT